MSQEAEESTYQDKPKESKERSNEELTIGNSQEEASERQGRARAPPPDVTPQDEANERQKIKEQGETHPPTIPYSHEGADIADTPLSQRTGPQADEGGAHPPEEESAARRILAHPIPLTEQFLSSTKARLKATKESIKEQTLRIGDRLGREREGGDSLHGATHHRDWAAGGEVPESDFTDNKHKTNDDRREHQKTSSSEAHRLVRELTQDQSGKRRNLRGAPYPNEGKVDKGVYQGGGIDTSLRYRSGGGGILSQLIKLQGAQNGQSSSTSSATPGSPTPSGATTPKKQRPKWYQKHENLSTSTLGASGTLSGASTPVSSEMMSVATKRRGGRKGDRKMRLEDEIRITVHIAEIIARQRYIMQLCKALMSFGAPTHRLEEYMQMTAKVLEVDSQYLYFPGCMVMSFDDPSTRTTEVKLVRVSQGIDLARLADTHSVYKNVVHDIIGVEEAIQELEDIQRRGPRYSKPIVVVTYGLASATVGPFAFGARPIDMPIIFINGCILGAMQHIWASNSVLYSNVFEVSASILMSFLARMFGSIHGPMMDGTRERLFCFSAIAESSIALILPGFLVLCSSLELQSHQLIAGSIRIVYAIIYSLFLGYGITVGTTIYGLIDPNATSEITCPKKGAFKNPYIQRFPFVALMVIWLIIINQGKWKQGPMMMFIALSGYISNYFSTKRLGSNSQVANTVGAFVIGIMGNLYSRLWHGHAATAILPAIFVLVPSGLAATGSLISGVQSANEIRTNISTSTGASTQPGAGLTSSGSLFTLAVGMIQVAIGITIGLFVAALIVYPFGKRRSGLFSF
ncbi:hypothetical protein ASPZODRAFT_148123 [Penicilliopsis zonata CBS 506.65]|uniref:Threonine/serine exporter-like N-terminal domain-containing protein n=1 Tax=Penicilliopsis zonata CBS 506.65 TaxID=1073090 RepID=A0A1L9STX7_9EURO|nr:hypothetical protein ASPZODRAFT_148123 [Penicilliopsis zonata CBS 506.65]OJJ50660.1 hypothetical protein ASPZODRAFT_148123 [Penicilliopsis zonata CBS 506.65]